MAKSMQLRRQVLGFVWWPAIVWFGGCAKPPPPPPPPAPTLLRATITAHAGVNPDITGRASPIVLRIYELKTAASFDHTDFFSLWDREKETLAADLVARDELQLRPGETKTVERAVDADTRVVAVVAAFRDLERATWRAAVGMRAHQLNAVSIDLGARTVSIAGH